MWLAVEYFLLVVGGGRCQMNRSRHLLKEMSKDAIAFLFPSDERPLSNRRLVAAILFMFVLLAISGFHSEWQGSVLLCCSWALAFLTGELSFFQKGSLLFLVAGLAIADSFAADNIATTQWSSCFENLIVILAVGLLCSLCILLCDAALAVLSIWGGWFGRRVFREEGDKLSWRERIGRSCFRRQGEPSLILRVPRADASHVRPVGFLLVIVWISLSILFRTMCLEMPIGAVLVGDQGILGIITAGFLGLHSRLWKPLKYSVLLFASYYVGASFNGTFPQIECQPFWTVLLRTAFGLAWLAIPFYLATFAWGRGKVFLRGLALTTLGTASVLLSIVALMVSGRTVDCLPYLAKLRPAFADRSLSSDFWLLEYKLGVCGCWRSTEFQRAYARMILDISPVGTSWFQFDGEKIKDPEAVRLLFDGLAEKRSWGALFHQASALISNMPEQERPIALGKLLEIYQSGRMRELQIRSQPGHEGFKEFSVYLAEVLATYDAQCALPELLRLYWDEPGNGIGLCILEVCYKTGHRLSNDQVAQIVYLYGLDEREQMNQNAGVVDERAPLAYFPDVAENSGFAKQLIMQSQPGANEEFFRVNHRVPFKEWAHQRFDEPVDGASIDLSLDGLW